MAVVGLTTYEALRPGGETGVGRYEDVQGVVDGLLAGRLGGERGKKVKRVVALTHIGYEEDIKLARNSRFVSSLDSIASCDLVFRTCGPKSTSTLSFCL